MALRTANQPPPLAGYNLYEQDTALVECVQREGGAPWVAEIAAFGEVLGGAPLEWGRLANEHPPKLRTHDRYGERIDEIEFHPAWDSLLQLGLDARLQSLPWIDPRPGAHAARAALLQGSQLLRHGDPAVAEAFCASRLDRAGGRAFGTLPLGLELAGILERHRPA